MTKPQPDSSEDSRIPHIVILVDQPAPGNHEARGVISGTDGYTDGTVTGLNMLAEAIADVILRSDGLSGLRDAQPVAAEAR